MKILHTSDWHVGRTFHGRDLLQEQEAVLSGLADTISDERVDVVVVAGDLFDRAVPNAEAVAVCSRVLKRLRAAGAKIVITPGNHDSAARLGFLGAFAEAGGLHLRTRVAELHQPVLFADAHGPVAVYGIPFLEPETARHALGIETSAATKSSAASKKSSASKAAGASGAIETARASKSSGASSTSEASESGRASSASKTSDNSSASTAGGDSGTGRTSGSSSASAASGDSEASGLDGASGASEASGGSRVGGADSGGGVGEVRGHAGVLTEAMRRVRQDLAGRPGARSVVLAHAFVTGGEPCESERTIAVGGVQDVPGSVFSGVDYVALGHLHGQQTLADHLRYSGSPVAYSFSEARHHKSVWLVELDAGGLAGVERRSLPVPRSLSTLNGTLEDLLLDPGHEPVHDHFLSVTLTDQVRPLDALRRLQKRFPHAVHVEWRPEGGRTGELRFAERVRGRTDEEIACCFIEDVRGDQPGRRELDLLREAFAAAAREEDA
ncbi:exonuclease SbcCD subunit D [Saccharothrix sp. HUAS TT1]|uniref:exonuclease SbcCD subunit D n=1 Tax=unclassified Saccharothrix TaxID=2593673 RepID=UPI00345B591A